MTDNMARNYKEAAEYRETLIKRAEEEQAEIEDSGPATSSASDRPPKGSSDVHKSLDEILVDKYKTKDKPPRKGDKPTDPDDDQLTEAATINPKNRLPPLRRTGI